MGTRHLTCVLSKGEIVLAQYGQWDGYLDGQGQTVVDFLIKADLKKFKSKLLNLKQVNDKEFKAYWTECGADPDSDSVSMDVSNKFKEKYPSLSRDTGAGILDVIYNSTETVPVNSDLNFAADSLFCEWLYLINLDTKELEIYKGFNEKRLSKTERFHFLQKAKSEYKPVKLYKTLKINKSLSANFAKLIKEHSND
jgi:hypothetical protein